MYKIAITGPESSGKTTLAKELADHFSCPWVPEYAREYLTKKKGIYTSSDLLEIMKGQLEHENKLAEEHPTLLLCDTDPLVIWVWSKAKFSSVDNKIERAFKTRHYDLHLLVYPDIDWEEDPLRENRYDRMDLFNVYLDQLKGLNKSFIIIKGDQEERNKKAIQAIDDLRK